MVQQVARNNRIHTCAGRGGGHRECGRVGAACRARETWRLFWQDAVDSNKAVQTKQLLKRVVAASQMEEKEFPG